MILLKAMFLGALLTWIVSSFIAGGGSTGGYLHIQYFTVQGHHIQWSWPLFLASTGLSFGILMMMR